METKDQKTTELVHQPQGQAAIIVHDYGAQVAQAQGMRRAFQDVMSSLMIDGVHYGVMPGTEDQKGQDGKPRPPRKCLFKAGAEVLCNVFRLRPKYRIAQRIEEPTFIHFEVECSIESIATGEVMATGMGSANTREDRYNNQCTVKVCPKCGKPTVFRSKKGPAAYFCWAAKGGCGAEFMPDMKDQLEQSSQLTPQKVWALHNTLLQQSHKRSLVAAVRTATACSDIFTQDMLPDPTDDKGHEEAEEDPRGKATTTQTATQPATQAKAEVVKFVDASMLRDLSWAIKDSGICVVKVDDPAKRDEAYRARRLEWINKMLDSIGQQPVVEAAKLTDPQAKILIELAKKGSKPEGWA